jgi:hypothetical protein
MKKPFLIYAATAAMALSTFTSPLLAAPPEHATPGHEFTAEDKSAFTDARIAGLKAGLKLTPAQEKNWPALENTLRDVAKARAARVEEWREKVHQDHGRGDAIERLHGRAKGLKTRAADLEKIADAAKPLFESLDEAQKRRLGVLLHAFSRSPWHRGQGGAHFGWHSDGGNDR